MAKQTKANSVSVTFASDEAIPVDVTAVIGGDPITGQALEAGGNGIIGWLSSLRKAITDRLPAALGAHGALKVEGVAFGTVIPVSDANGYNVLVDIANSTSGTNASVTALGPGLRGNSDSTLSDIVTALNAILADLDAIVINTNRIP